MASPLIVEPSVAEAPFLCMPHVHSEVTVSDKIIYVHWKVIVSDIR